MSVTETTRTGGPKMEGVGAVPERMVQTWASHDASGFADLFTADGVMLLPGVECFGRERIEAYMSKAFTDVYRDTTVVGTPRGMRILSPQAVLLFTEGGVVAPGEVALSERNRIHATWVLVERDGGWRIQAYQNCPAGSL